MHGMGPAGIKVPTVEVGESGYTMRSNYSDLEQSTRRGNPSIQIHHGIVHEGAGTGTGRQDNPWIVRCHSRVML